MVNYKVFSINTRGNIQRELETSPKEEKFETKQDNSKKKPGKKGTRKRNTNRTDKIFVSNAEYKLYEYKTNKEIRMERNISNLNNFIVACVHK